MREQTVADLQQRYSIDIEHAARIEQTARYCLEQINGASSEYSDHHEQLLLSWAARLHEIGQAIAHSGYQKHGAYLVHNSDLPGFSRQEQHYVATLIRNHRRKISTADFDNLPDNGGERILLLCILLRLAIVLNRSRATAELPAFRLTISDRNIEIAFPDGWLEAHPLTGADLETEAGYLQAAGYVLTFG